MRKSSETLASSQVEIDFGPRVRANALWLQALDLVRAIVARVTPKEVAFQLDTSSSNLADALNERDRKAFRAEALICLLLMADDDERQAVLEPIANALGFEVIKAKKLSPEQRLARLESDLLERFGPAGAELVAKHRR